MYEGRHHIGVIFRVSFDLQLSQEGLRESQRETGPGGRLQFGEPGEGARTALAHVGAQVYKSRSRGGATVTQASCLRYSCHIGSPDHLEHSFAPRSETASDIDAIISAVYSLWTIGSSLS